MLRILYRSFFFLGVSVLLYAIFNACIFFDISKVVFNHFPGECKLIKNAEHGSEAIVLWKNETVLFSSGFKDLLNLKSAKYAHVRGRILRFDLRKPDAPAIAMKVEGFDLASVVPHGMALASWGGIPQLLLIIHAEGQERIEWFDVHFAKNLLSHRGSITSKDFRSLNSVTWLSESEFLTTNMAYFPPGSPLALCEPFFSWGNILRCNLHGDCKVAYEGLSFPNGIALSSDSRHVYAASSMKKSVSVFEWNRGGKLEMVQTALVGTFVDNVFIADDKLYVGSHPVGYKMLFSMMDPTYPAPSQVLTLSINRETGYLEKVEELLSDSGDTLFGSTSAIKSGKHLVVGTMIHKALYCDLSRPLG